MIGHYIVGDAHAHAFGEFMKNFLYVDNSNVWIEGMHVAAVGSGAAPDIWAAQTLRITEPFRIDFGRLYAFAGGQTSEVTRAVLYGSEPPANDSLWNAAKVGGFEVITYERNAANREKKIDTKIATDIVADSYRLLQPGDEVTLVAGDRDYVPVAEEITSREIPFHVVFWDHAANELKNAASSFTSLNHMLDYLSRQ